MDMGQGPTSGSLDHPVSSVPAVFLVFSVPVFLISASFPDLTLACSLPDLSASPLTDFLCIEPFLASKDCFLIQAPVSESCY